MRYIVDHDYHIHSKISSCSNFPEQTNERILQYALDNGLKKICLTDHFWDETVVGASDWYKVQNFAHISKALPLPQDDKVEFIFGCETDMDKTLTVGLSPENYDKFDFIVIPTTHMHMMGFTLTQEQGATPESRANLWIERLEALLNMDLPFHKIGIAHLVCRLISFSKTKEETYDVLELLPQNKLIELFTKAARLGVGIELNSADMNFTDENAERALRIFKIAKQCGCKFYLGSDAHRPKEFIRAKEFFERAITLLQLTEDDKFHIK